MRTDPEEMAPGKAEPGASSSLPAHSPLDALQKEGATFDMGAIKRGVTDIPEVAAYADRIGATLRGMRKLVVCERAGAYHRDIAEVRFGDAGEIAAPEGFEPTEAEATAIRAAWARYVWPQYQPFLFTGRDVPHDPARFPFQRADDDDLAICWDEGRQHIRAVEERRYNPDGTKDIYVWTYWSDGQWRIAEPERLPLYGLETIRDASTIIVHEGPKAAKVIQRLIADDSESGWRAHPWGAELRGPVFGATAHVAWMGGATRPEATDFTPLRKAGARLIFIADNDRPGMDAISRISRSSRAKMEALCFTDEWPQSFDLADPFPPDRARAGTEMAHLVTPATWATNVIQTGARQAYEMRPEALAEWRWTVSPPLFFHDAYPGRGFTEVEVDAMMRPFSDAEHTARLIRRNFSARADGVDYLPGRKPVVEFGGQRIVNQWKRCSLKERPGQAWPLGRLLVSQFPEKADRKHVARWGATLSAHPETRMEYAILLRSETQGTGKTTLANIAGELVGRDNVSRPNEAALTEGNFNSHLARKRLVIVDEIYSGHSRKTYNRLKAPITDTRLRVNEKYQPEYEITNFAHFIFNSNDLIAMLIDSTDRRFFIPRMSERKLPRQFWAEFHTWLADGGLGAIKRCAREFAERHGAVLPGEAAPMSVAKATMIEDSVSDEMRSVRDAARELVERGSGDGGERVAVTLEGFQTWHNSLCREHGWRRLNGNRLAKELRRAGMFIRGRDDKQGLDHRVKIGGRKLPIASNFDADAEGDAVEAIRSALRNMNDLGFGEPPM